jgi:hypothetical protein
MDINADLCKNNQINTALVLLLMGPVPSSKWKQVKVYTCL